MNIHPVDGALLGYLDSGDRDALLSSGVVRHFAAGAVLLHEGDPSDHLFVLMSGWVRVYTTSQEGQETLIAFRGPGDVLGELAALHRWPRTVSNQALDPVEVVQLRREQFAAHLADRPTIALAVIKQLSVRLRQAERTVVELATLDVSRRVAAYLLRLAGNHGTLGDNGVRIDLPISQQDIANHIGASLRGVARTIAMFRERGIVHTTRQQIVILRPEVLRAYVGPMPNGT